MNYNQSTSFNASKNYSTEGFFRKIYRYIINLIQKNPQIYNKDTNKKIQDSFNYYASYYQEEFNYHVKEPLTSKTGIINLLNDCYIISFLQILFHTPNFIDILKLHNIKKQGEDIIYYLIMVSEYPFNAEIFYNFKQLLGLINPDYAKPWPNDSQEFGIDLIAYLISETKMEIYKNNINFEFNSNNDIDFINSKKKIYENFVSSYQKDINEIEKLFLFNEIDTFCGEKNRPPKISSNLHMELIFNKYEDYVNLETLLQNKYNKDKTKLGQNQNIIIRKIINLPEILIISIYRKLSNERINTTRLLFKDTLDLKEYIDFELFEDSNKRTTYKLYAINECVKTERNSHYICYIRLQNQWFIFDDDKKVKEINGLFQASPFIVGLFYQRDK